MTKEQEYPAGEVPAGSSGPGRKPKSVPVTQLGADEARRFFLKNKSYCGIELPLYFDFSPLLGEVLSTLEQHSLSNISKDVRSTDSVNHTILSNKGRGHDWRPLQLMHPALYVHLVMEMTQEHNWAMIIDAFGRFEMNDKVECSSIPLSTSSDLASKEAQISSWWLRFEQRSIELALEFGYMAKSDIVDCYSSMYTHAVSWAIHGKEVAKKARRDRTMVGNSIDKSLQDMHAGQTNGIPQGSALSDFIAEIVLGYVDDLVVEALGQKDRREFRILRFRDDYRIFAHSREDASLALQCLSEAAREVGLKLNASKTDVTDDIISWSVKEEKVEWSQRRPRRAGLLNTLMDIRRHSLRFPDAGSVRTGLSAYHRRVLKRKRPYKNIQVLASVVLDIAIRNPSSYPNVASILSVFVDLLKGEDADTLATSALRKFSNSPNSGLMEVWLQRIVLKTGAGNEFDELLCRKVHDPDTPLWNSEWITYSDLKRLIDSADVVNREILEEMEVRIASEEVDLFGAFDY